MGMGFDGLHHALNVGIIIQARLASTRLPGKVLLPINGKPILSWVVKAAKEAAEQIGAQVAIASPDLGCDRYDDVPVFKPTFEGRDVLREYYDIERELKLDHIIRLTGDCPMLTADNILAAWEQCCCLVWGGRIYYLYYGPDGVDVEVFSMSALEWAHREATGEDREHVCTWMRKNEAMWRLYCPWPIAQSGYRSVNTPSDLVWVRERMTSNEIICRCPVCGDYVKRNTRLCPACDTEYPGLKGVSDTIDAS